MSTLAISAFSEMMDEAKTLVDSGFLPKAINTPAKALAIMTMSRELGIGYWTGFNGINVISGKPTISPQLMLALIYKRHPEAVIQISGDAKSCTVFMQRKDGQSYQSTFKIEDAAKIMTKEDNKTIPLTEKYNWRQQPAVMLKWRAVAACARVIFPDVIMGFYTPEEIEPDVRVDDDGAIMGEVKELPAESGEQANGNGHEPRQDAPGTTPHGNGGQAPADANDVAEIEKQLPPFDVMMTGLSGQQLYAIQEWGSLYLAARGMMAKPAKKHFENRWMLRFGVKNLKEINQTVGEFLAMMADNYGAQAEVEPGREAAADK